MEDKTVLGTFGDYTYRFYNSLDQRLIDYYRRGYSELAKSGNTVLDLLYDVDVAIILEKDEKIIAATFLNINKRPKVVTIQLIYVEPEFRNKHIHRTMHQHIDVIGKRLDKDMVVSTVHANNKVMLNYIVDKVGYSPLWHTFKRDLK